MVHEPEEALSETPAVPDWEDLGISPVQHYSPVYIAGPMTGLPEYNFPAFHEAAARIRADGLRVVSPAELDEHDSVPPGERPWAWYLTRDLKALLECNAVAVLDGWRESRGARLEVHVASALGLPVVSAKTLLPIRESVLEEAQRLIYGDRNDTYGHPLDDFARTGRMWGAILGIPDVLPEHVGLCMSAVKISREVNAPKRDNRVDGPGYWGCVDMIHTERARRSHLPNPQDPPRRE